MARNGDPANALYLAAAARPLAERAAFLDQACAGDAKLRAQVEGLLKAHEDTGSAAWPGTGMPGGLPTTEPPGADALGSRIGRYKLLQRIGEGGMGTVFMAEQQEPVVRKVALKIIKPGMDSAQVLARFEAERQALALMDHPNIAKVLDGGLTDDRRPFFVMELVKGIPLTKFCDEAKMSPRQRLELFIPVCQAVQHAHQKGIIHRDLKPSNILVTLYDGKPTPKVIDFGVAKATGAKLTDKTMFTEFGAVVGTLDYMAPEQASLSALDVDTRTDVYALGVILYELLTGLRPFDSVRLRKAAFDEALRILREEEPPKPSTRVSGAATLPSAAALRQTEPARLTRLLRGELDWIIMKCLEKERGRRYETANSLANDVERFLRDEPVLAGPPTAGYRLKKFFRRHRTAAIASAAGLVLVVFALASVSWGLARAVEAEREMRKERDEKDAALTGLLTAQANEKIQRERAEVAAALNTVDQALVTLRGDRRLGLLSLAKLLPTIPPHANELREYVAMAILANGQLLRPLVGDAFPWKHLYLAPGGALFGVKASVRDIEEAGVWDPLMGERLAALDMDEREWGSFTPTGVSPSGRHFAVFPKPSRKASVIDTQGRRVLFETAPEFDSVTNIQVAADGRSMLLLGSVHGETQVQLCRAGADKPLTLSGRCWSLHPSGDFFMTAEPEGPIEVRSAQTGSLVKTIDAFPAPIHNVEFSPFGKCACVHSEANIYWLDVEGWKPDRKACRLGSDSASSDITFFADDLALVSGSLLRRGEELRPLPFSNGKLARIVGRRMLDSGGQVYDLQSLKRLPPAPGRFLPAELKEFALDGRLLDCGELLDLATERPLVPGASLRLHRLPDGTLFAHPLGSEGNSILLPRDHAMPIPEKALALWAGVLARGELNPSGEFVEWSEEQWNRKREELAQSPSIAGFPFPGAIAADRAFFRRQRIQAILGNDDTPKPEDWQRWIAVEPSWDAYRLRALYAEGGGNKVRDELEAARRSSPRFWSRYSRADFGWRLALERGAALADHEAGLRWCEERERAGVFAAEPSKALLLLRLGRADAALAELRARQVRAEVSQAVTLFMNPWSVAVGSKPSWDRPILALALARAGELSAAKSALQQARTQRITAEKGDVDTVTHPDYAQLLAEAEALIERGNPKKQP